MTETATVNAEATSSPHPLKRPIRVPLPKLVQGIAFATVRRRFIRQARKRYGQVFELNVPFFGRTVFVADPALVRQVFTASTDDLINVQPNLSRVFGPGSVFALDRAEHRNRRKLLAPPFHGQSIKNYEKVIEEETRAGHLDGLAPRENEVLDLMAQGLSNAAIAARLHLSVKTVEPLVSSIFVKLGLPSDADSNRRVLAVVEYLRR